MSIQHQNIRLLHNHLHHDHQCPSQGVSLFSDSMLKESLNECCSTSSKRMLSRPCSYTAALRCSGSKVCLKSTESRSDWGSAHIDPDRSRTGKRGDSHSPTVCPELSCSLPTEREVAELNQRWRLGADWHKLTLTRGVYTCKRKSILVKIMQIVSFITGNLLNSIKSGLKN